MEKRFPCSLCCRLWIFSSKRSGRPNCFGRPAELIVHLWTFDLPFTTTAFIIGHTCFCVNVYLVWAFHLCIYWQIVLKELNFFLSHLLWCSQFKWLTAHPFCFIFYVLSQCYILFLLCCKTCNLWLQCHFLKAILQLYLMYVHMLFVCYVCSCSFWVNICERAHPQCVCDL